MNSRGNYIILLLIASVLFLSVAGCISLGSQTTDIMIGGTAAGTITVTPTDSLLSADASAGDRFNVEIDLFGFKYSKEGLTKSESDSLVSLLSSQNLGVDTIGDILSGFTPSVPQQQTSDGFLNQILNMPISSTNNKTVSASLNISGAADAATSFVDKMGELFS